MFRHLFFIENEEGRGWPEVCVIWSKHTFSTAVIWFLCPVLVLRSSKKPILPLPFILDFQKGIFHNKNGENTSIQRKWFGLHKRPIQNSLVGLVSPLLLAKWAGQFAFGIYYKKENQLQEHSFISNNREIFVKYWTLPILGIPHIQGSLSHTSFLHVRSSASTH